MSHLKDLYDQLEANIALYQQFERAKGNRSDTAMTRRLRNQERTINQLEEHIALHEQLKEVNRKLRRRKTDALEKQRRTLERQIREIDGQSAKATKDLRETTKKKLQPIINLLKDRVVPDKVAKLGANKAAADRVKRNFKDLSEALTSVIDKPEILNDPELRGNIVAALKAERKRYEKSFNQYQVRLVSKIDAAIKWLQGLKTTNPVVDINGRSDKATKDLRETTKKKLQPIINLLKDRVVPDKVAKLGANKAAADRVKKNFKDLSDALTSVIDKPETLNSPELRNNIVAALKAERKRYEKSFNQSQVRLVSKIDAAIKWLQGLKNKDVEVVVIEEEEDSVAADEPAGEPEGEPEGEPDDDDDDDDDGDDDGEPQASKTVNPMCPAEEEIKDPNLIPPALRKKLNRPNGYRSLEDAAIQWARRRNPATKEVRSGGLASEATARKDLKALWDSMVEKYGEVDAAQKFFRRVVGIVSCSNPCTATVRFPNPASLVIDCQLGTYFRPGMGVFQVQAEVERMADVLGIPTPPMPAALVSNCPPRGAAKKDSTVARAEEVTLTAAQLVARDIIANALFRTMTKGALLWHSVGAGKTCAAVAMASTMIEQGWRVKWFSVASLKQRPLLDAFFKRKCHSLPIPDVVSEAAQLSTINRFIEINSYSTLSHAFESPRKNDKATKWLSEARRRDGYTGSDPLHKTLIIFDEPHKVSQIRNPQEKMSWRVVTDALRRSYRDSGENSARLVMLDATPMVAGASDLMTMLNALHAQDILPATAEAATSKGLVSANGVLTTPGRDAVIKAGNAVISYVNLSADRSRFAYAKKWTYNPVALSKKQLGYINKTCTKLAKGRKRTCLERNSVAIDMPRDKSKVAARAKDSYPLVTALVKTIKEQDTKDAQSKGDTFKHVIFTNVRHVTHANDIAAVMVVNGFKVVKPQDAQATPGKNNVMVLSGSDVAAGKGRDAYLDTFNSEVNNPRGERVRFLIVDGRFREGINLFDVRHFHMMQPLSDFEERQAVGRVLRMCGSTFLPSDDNIWQVRLHLYDPVDASKGAASLYDLLDVRESAVESTTMEQLEDLCRDIALDRRLFQQYNVVAEDEGWHERRAVAASHLCDKPPVNGRCDTPGEVKVTNRYGVECCVVPCKTAPVNGQCKKGWVKGASEVDPNSQCCYSRGSKRGKEIAAANPGRRGRASAPPQELVAPIQGLGRASTVPQSVAMGPVEDQEIDIVGDANGDADDDAMDIDIEN